MINSLSCSWPGACVAAGDYTSRGRHYLPMEVAEVKGTWLRAQGPDGGSGSPPSAYRFPSVGTVDCTSTGYCAAGSFYLDISGKYDALAVTAHLR